MAASPISLPPFSGHSLRSSPSSSSNRSNSLSSPTLLNTTISQNSKPSHTCPSCARTFSRAEHLDRHLTTHLPSNSSKSFICPSCGKGFTRKDVLTRHVRAVHETKRSDVRRSRRRSCRRCAGFKIKCSGGAKGSADGSRSDEACEACKKRGVMCVYDFGTHTEGPRPRASSDAGKQSSQDSGEDEMLDDVSEEEANSRPNERLNKRRRISEGFSGSGTSSVSQLLSAALLSSPEVAQRMDEDSYTAAATVASLVNSAGSSGQRTPDMISADEMMTAVTNKMFESVAGRGTLSPRSTYPNGERTSYFSPRFSSDRGTPQSPSITERRQGSINGAAQTRLSLTPSQFLASLNQPTTNGSQQQFSTNNTTFGNISSSDTAASSNPAYNPRPTASFGTHDAPTGSTILPPPSFGVLPEVPRSNSPRLFGGSLLTPIERRDDDPDPSQVDSEDNWFFDAGIFETDWLRWGGFGSDSQPAPELDPLPTSNLLSERHMSICSSASASGNVPSLTSSRTSGGNSKDLSSPASTSSEYNAYPHNTKDIRLPSVSPIKDSSNMDDFLPWGWQASREEPKKRITLPPLRQVLEECSTQRHEHTPTTFSPRFSSADPKLSISWMGSVSDSIRNDLISVLKVPYSRHPYYDDCDIESKFPSKELIDGFIALYFKHFHYIMPMIHKPTFKIENSPSILLVAMASIGASYSDMEGAKSFADGLSELCKRALTWMAEYDNAYLRSEYYLTAFCLQHLYALGSGHQALYDAADSTRSFLVSNARRCGLFSDNTSPSSPQSSSAPGSPRGTLYNDDNTRSNLSNLDEHQLNALWLSWCEQEKRKRVAWAIFSYDCSFSTLSNRRGAVCMNDIKSRLPCEEAMWEAPTAQAWAAACPQSSSGHSNVMYRGMPFWVTLRDIISGKLSAKEIPSWGKELCAWALGRLLWDFKEMEQTALGCGLRGVAGLGLPALTDGLKETKEAALNALNSLGEAAWESEQREFDRVHANRRSLTTLIAHYSYLHCGVPTISIILSLARSPPAPALSGNKCPAETVEDPRVTRLRNIFSANPVHARTIAWHAGQIIGISRYRPVHTPAETMRVFLAGVVLWGVAKWFVECRSMAAANTWTCGLNDAEDIPLDAIPISPNPTSAANGSSVSGTGSGYGMPAVVVEWLKTGKGRATIRRDGEPGQDAGETQLCSEQGAKDVLQVVVSILGKMRIWGLGAEFRRVLEGMGK